VLQPAAPWGCSSVSRPTSGNALRRLCEFKHDERNGVRYCPFVCNIPRIPASDRRMASKRPFSLQLTTFLLTLLLVFPSWANGVSQACRCVATHGCCVDAVTMNESTARSRPAIETSSTSETLMFRMQCGSPQQTTSTVAEGICPDSNESFLDQICKSTPGMTGANFGLTSDALVPTVKPHLLLPLLDYDPFSSVIVAITVLRV